jgi:NAD-dependent SIR2 family protein deacetylase
LWDGASALPPAFRPARRAQVLIVDGTSVQVYPAAGLIPLALRSKSAEILPQLV